MLLRLDFSSDTPIYIQIRNQVVMGIAGGLLTPGEKLPTVRALADEPAST
jgi:DNA-binding transcriptional regulator YhcF (GntR family)